jgi:signal transduction histidine kinase/ActR/RegA family two-component response regulator
LAEKAFDMNASVPVRTFQSTTRASRREWQLGLGLVALSFVAFVATVPFVRIPLAQIPSFIPSYESALFFNDLITSVLLFGLFIQLRARALLVLAAGYLFDASIIIPHALSFPGAFSSTGLLGAGTQTTAWLYMFWHGGFPLFVMSYAFLRSRELPAESFQGSATLAIAATLFGVIAVTVALTVLATAGEDLLPEVIRDGNYALSVTKGVGPTVWLLSLIALFSLWRRNATQLDLWLMVVMCAWLFDIALSAVIGSHRYDLGFYAGRIYGLFAASFVLATLLMGMARERRAVQQQLVQAQKMEAVGQLTGGLAHDFNNMLGAVIGNLDLAIEEVKDRPAVLALLNEALEGALRSAELVKRLLAFSRKQPLNLQTLDLSHTIGKLKPLLCSAMGERVGLDVVIRDDKLWPVKVDPVQLENTILNLCINARDAMPNGGRLTIEMSNFELESPFAPDYPDLTVGKYVALSITDTGAGMPADVVARVFEPFFTTKEVGKGSGLGLSMVYGYMKQSGGGVKIYSEVGIGTTVSLHFPVGARGALDLHPASSPLAIPRGSERVLVVEDNPQIRKIAMRIVGALGYKVEEAADAEGALGVLQRIPCDLVFSDVVLPGMNGIALAGEIRRRHPGLPVLLTSGFSSKIAAGDLRALGADFIAKPYRQAALAAALRGALDTRKQAA